MSTNPTLELRDLRVAYRVRGIDREVLRGISLSILPGEAYGLVGESGCGKSTLLRALNRMNDTIPRVSTEGRVRLDGENIYDQIGRAHV